MLTPFFEVPRSSAVRTNGRVFVKNEAHLSVNPTGTIKDRRTKRILEHWQRTGKDVCFACLTSGNIGISLVHHLSSMVPFFGYCPRAFIVLDDSNYSKWIAKSFLSNVQTVVSHRDLTIPLEPLELRAMAADALGVTGESIFDISDTYHSNQASDSVLGRSAYQAIAEEIVLQLKEADSRNKVVVVVPVGCGDFAIGLSEGFQKLDIDIEMIGVCIHGQNPLPLAMRSGRSDIQVVPYLPNGIAPGLSTPMSGLLDKLTVLFKNLQHIVVIDSATLTKAQAKGHWGCQLAEPTSLPAFLALDTVMERFPQYDIVVVNTGRSIAWRASTCVNMRLGADDDPVQHQRNGHGNPVLNPERGEPFPKKKATLDYSKVEGRERKER